MPNLPRLFSPLKVLTRRLTPPPTEKFDELAEGAAKILYHKGEVFYNPAQVVNRDLSVLILRWLSRQTAPLRILEALSATGLRSIRYYKEVPNVKQVIANDLDPDAVQTIRRNVAHNSLSEEHVKPNQGDAITVMALARDPEKRFSVVDLDPYGSAAPFLESAVNSTVDGGLLAVTCTDLAVLCGNSPEICFGRYASTPLKAPTAHEMAVRIVFAAIQSAANKHGRAVEAVFCVKIDFYVRLFVRVRESRALAQKTPSQMGMVLQCGECGTQRFQTMGRIRETTVTGNSRRKRKRMKASGKDKPEENGNGTEETQTRTHIKFTPAQVATHVGQTCSICGGQMLLGGPIWFGKLVGGDVAAEVLKDLNEGDGCFTAKERVSALVTLLDEEVDVPLFMHLPSMCKVLRIAAPPAASVRAVIAKKGYKVSQSHTDPQAIKTDAPPELVWDILRLWVEKNGNPFEKRRKKEESADNAEDGERRQSAGERILSTKATAVSVDEVDFSVKKDRFVRRGVERTAVRYPHNPEPNWGPKARAGKRKREDDKADAENDTNS